MFDGLILSGANYPNFLTRIQKIQISFVVFGNNVVDFEGEKNILIKSDTTDSRENLRSSAT